MLGEVCKTSPHPQHTAVPDKTRQECQRQRQYVWSAVNDISINCPFLSFVNVLRASSDESIDTASWYASFMEDGRWVETPIKNKLHCVLEILLTVDHLQNSLARYQDFSRVTAFHRDIR